MCDTSIFDFLFHFSFTQYYSISILDFSDSVKGNPAHPQKTNCHPRSGLI